MSPADRWLLIVAGVLCLGFSAHAVRTRQFWWAVLLIVAGVGSIALALGVWRGW